ncbi:A-kinase anchor protein 13 isoform X4 [Lingula anatina]|uniref:A-kinase anchor protein 13 isoform X4 n=1 Tax=Lingula anatina TaxID=7574 RepID=A0A1S3J7M1_LINAN|nr:A-kinase anchor protein 13 isoform X4 [Lingula anatina]|eukprot:XP_013406407.1 A-kinase anchor protein 13 isoform X4 [Lingula anatina]
MKQLKMVRKKLRKKLRKNSSTKKIHAKEERRDSLNRFSTSCPSLADPEVPYKYNDHHQSMLNIGEERDDQVEEEEEEDDDEDEVDYPANDSEELSQYPSVRNSAQNHSTNTASDMRNIDEGVKIRINDVTVDSSEDNYDVLDPVMHSKDLYQETSPSAGTTGTLEENTPHKNVKPKQRRWSHHVMGMSVEKQQFRNKLLAVSGKSMSLSSLDSAAEESEEEEGYIHKQLGNHKTSASLSPGSSSSLSAGTDLTGMNPRHSWAGSYTTDIIGSPEASGARNGMSPPDRPLSQGNSSIRSLTDIGLDLNSSNESQKDAMAPNQTNVSTTATSNPPMSVRTPKQKNVTLLQQSKMSVSTPSLSSVKEGEDCRRSGTFNEGHITKEEAFTEKQSHVTIRKLVEEHDALRKSQENGMTDEESKRKARVSMIEFLNEKKSVKQWGRRSVIETMREFWLPANFEEDEENMEQEQKKEPKEEKKRKLSFMQKFGSHRQKRKDKEGKKTHQFVSVSFSNSTSCDICGKTLANKPAVSCENCSINVHDSSCKDSVPPCLKLKKDKRPYRREIQERCPPPVGGQQGGPILKSSQSFVEAGSVPAGRVKQTSVSFSSLPNRNSSPNDQLNAGRWSSGAYSQWRRVAAKLGIDKAIAEESQESLDGASISMGQDPSTLSLQSRLRNNLEDTVSLSMESLDEGAQVEFEDDEDLMIRGPEPEAWSVYVNKKEISKLGLSKKDVKRQDHLWEIVMTEKHHLRTLKIMQRVYSHGLVHEVGLPPELVDRLFPRLEDLIDISATFLQRLQERQDEHPNKFVSQIGDLLIEQFDSPSSTRMVSAFGEFCSKKKEAEALYKDLFKQEKKFQNFIRKCSGNGLCKHHSIPDCILLVTQRLTKMPTLIEAVIKKTQETNPDHALLKKADMLARNILNAIDAQVDAKEKEQRLIEIYNKLDVRSTAVYKGKKFKKSDLLSNNRKLVYESTIAWKTARGKTIDVLIVVLSDLVFFLQENNQKYTFFTQDNKASVVSLYKLLVREKGATRDNKGVYVISQSKDTPEMYEFVCKSGEERKQMINIVSAAIRNCPEEDDDEGVPSESEEERKIREARAQKVRECLSFLQRSQDQIRELLKDRLHAVFDMFDHQPKEEHLLQPYGQDEDANPAEWIDRAAKEAERLSWLLQSGSTNLSRSVSSVGEHQSGSYTPPPVPKRSETFGGFEVSADTETVDSDIVVDKMLDHLTKVTNNQFECSIDSMSGAVPLNLDTGACVNSYDDRNIAHQKLNDIEESRESVDTGESIEHGVYLQKKRYSVMGIGIEEGQNLASSEEKLRVRRKSRSPLDWIKRKASLQVTTSHELLGEATKPFWSSRTKIAKMRRSSILRHNSDAGEHKSVQASRSGPQLRRVESFAGFGQSDGSSGSVKRRPPPFPKDDDGSFSSFQSFNKDGGVDTDSAIASDTTTVSNSSSSKKLIRRGSGNILVSHEGVYRPQRDPALQKLKRTSTFLSGLLPTRNAEKDDSPDVRHSDKSSDLGSISEFSISSVSLIPPVREQAACLEQILRYLAQAMHASIHQNTRLERCKAHLVESNEKVEKLTAETKQYQERKGTFRHNQQLEELRRLQSSINTERTDWEKTKERERMRLEAERETVEEHRKDIEKQQAEMEQQREELKRQRAAFQRQIDLFEQRQQQIQQEQQKEQQQLLQLQQQQQQLQKQLSSGNMIKSGLKDVNSTSVKNDKFSTTGKENNSLDPTRLSPQGLVISHRRSASADWNKDSNDKRATEGEAFEPMKEEYARSLQEPLNRKTRSDDRRISHHVFEGQNRRADTMPSLGISKRDTRENLPIHLVSATNEQKLQGAALKQQFPHKLGSSNSSPSFSGIIPKKLASSSSSSQPSSHNSQSNKSASLKHNSSGGGGMLPMKLAERSRSDSKERSQSMSSPQSAGKKDQSVIYF